MLSDYFILLIQLWLNLVKDDNIQLPITTHLTTGTPSLILVFLLISNLISWLHLHQFLGTKTTEANKSLKSDANGSRLLMSRKTRLQHSFNQQSQVLYKIVRFFTYSNKKISTNETLPVEHFFPHFLASFTANRTKSEEKSVQLAEVHFYQIYFLQNP